MTAAARWRGGGAVAVDFWMVEKISSDRKSRYGSGGDRKFLAGNGPRSRVLFSDVEVQTKLQPQSILRDSKTRL